MYKHYKNNKKSIGLLHAHAQTPHCIHISILQKHTGGSSLGQGSLLPVGVFDNLRLPVGNLRGQILLSYIL